jgi:FAD-linked sulfhydryl oxidase
MAANYPEAPDALHRVQARRFFDTLGLLYPCSHCAVGQYTMLATS